MRIRNKGRLRRSRSSENFSPMDGLGNMADAMLVFACGLILALIMSWNVDVTDKGEIQNPEKKYEVEGVDICRRIENNIEQCVFVMYWYHGNHCVPYVIANNWK